MTSSNRKRSSHHLLNSVLLGAVIIIFIIPMLFLPNAEFAGADGQIITVIGEVNPNYEPWIEPLWEPPSGEIESLLFALQAALGAGTICYIIGFWHGKRKAAKG